MIKAGVMVSFYINGTTPIYGDVINVEGNLANVSYYNPFKKEFTTDPFLLIDLVKVGNYPKIIKDKI